MSNKLFIFGFGFSSHTIAQSCAAQFDTIIGTTRSVEKFSHIERRNVQPTLFDGNAIDENTLEHLSNATHVLVSIGPNEMGDPVLNAYKKAIINNKNLKWIGYLSTVGVYGNHDGEWVDEETKVKPVSKRSVQRVKAEDEWLALGEKHTLPVAVFRLSGIYGPGRNTFMNIEKGKARRLVKKNQVFNRIHREDIGSAVSLAIEKTASGIFNITDNEPAPPQDVVAYAYSLLDKTPPEELDFETADLTPMARSFYGENKRVSNAKSKRVLGLEYKWPDYKTSLKSMYDNDTWQA